MLVKNVPSFHTYVPVGVTDMGRELFRAGMKLTVRKFAEADKKHKWNDAFLTSSREEVQQALAHHVEKGDPRDVIILCLICIWHGWKTKG